ncbi:MAG: GNAT family N-acetyltransferase [Armatimonadota bacterium]|nr:GNAT family N-acetyltransferase [Armatimonadota bacterium]MDR7484799.1 GNAT family N-acetyltransferase [Armatimonadota bacterium]MDR7531914.1 GNAT family N-acetyltransferase [Armatimonadota bacterium]MDR7534741.1 GNAT family N-acetyltransferase [Armatimonadota bacterium]
MDIVIAPLRDAPPADPQALPAEWAAWAEEPGHVVAVQEEARVLGRVHVVVVGRSECWLEGLWVQPAARGRGVGGRLVAAAEEVARDYGAEVARTAIPRHDYGAAAVAERAGFQRVCDAVVLLANLPHGPIDFPFDTPVASGEGRDVPALVEFLAASPTLAAWRGLVPLGWRFRRLVPELVRGLAKDGRIVRSGDAVEGAAAFALRGDTVVFSWLDAPRPQRQALFAAVAERARTAGAVRAAVFAPDAWALEGIRAAFTPHPWCPDGLLVVEKRLG